MHFFRELDDIQTRLNRLCGSGLSLQASPLEMVRGGWAPPADVQETDRKYVIKVYCPDVTATDVTLTLQDRVLTIEAARAQVEKSLHFGTIGSPGRFVRRFTLPIEVEPCDVHAELTDGVLSIHLPKVPKPVARAIHVKVVQGSRP